jgi:hypothetical protein
MEEAMRRCAGIPLLMPMPFFAVQVSPLVECQTESARAYDHGLGVKWRWFIFRQISGRSKSLGVGLRKLPMSGGFVFLRGRSAQVCAR